MKNLFKKSLSVLMITFLTVFVLGISNKVKAASTTYTFSNYTAGTQYAENEEHVLDDVLTLYTTQCHFTSQLRVYSSSSHDGYVVSNELPGKILSLGFNMGNTKDTLNVYGSTDGASWTLVGGVTTTSTSYLDYTLDFTGVEYTYFKLDVAGTSQIRIASLTVSYESSDPFVTVSSEDDNYTDTIGTTVQLTATATNTSGTPTWSSSNENVATVDANGLVTAQGVGKATITANVNGTEGTYDYVVYPTAESELTIAEALQVCELTGQSNAPYTYTTTGVIESIDSAYNGTYDNITVTITDGTNSIKAYRLAGGSELVLGDKIKVTGTLVNYYGDTHEFIEGCTYVAVADSADVATIKESLNAINSYMTMAYKYTVESKTVLAAASATITFDDTAKRTVFNTEQQVWEENGITVTNDKDSSTSSIADYSNPVRFYKSSKVTVAYGVEFNKVYFYCNTAAYAEALLGATVDGGTLVVDADNTKKVTLTLASATTSVTVLMPAQVRVDSICVEEESTVTTTEYTYSEAEFRIRCGVDAAIKDIAGVESYGIQVTANGTTKDYAWNTTDAIYGSDTTCLFVTVSLGDALNNKERLSTEFTVCAYVVVDGVTYTSTNTKTYSIESMVTEYFGNESTKALVADLYNRITNNLI